MKAILSSNRHRYLHGHLFWFALISTAITAFLNIAVVRLIALAVPMLPLELFDPLYANGYYNFGVLKIENLQDLSVLSTEQLISSAFLGGFLAINISIFIPLFICNSFKSGVVQNAYVRGKSKLAILTAYVISSAEIFLFIFAVYVISLTMFFFALTGSALNSLMLGDCLIMFAHQLFAHFAFLVLCVSAAFIIRKSLSCVIIMLTGVLAFPMFLATIDLILRSSYRLSSLWIVNIIGSWASIPMSANTIDYFVVLLTFVFSYVAALLSFARRDIGA